MITNAVLIAPKAAEASQTTQYTSTGCKTIIDKFTVTNANAAVRTLSVNLAVAGSAADGNLVLKLKAIAPGETYLCPEVVGQLLDVGQALSTIASSATSLTISASGRQIT